MVVLLNPSFGSLSKRERFHLAMHACNPRLAALSGLELLGNWGEAVKLQPGAPHSAGLKYCSHTRHVSRHMARCVGLRGEDGVSNSQSAACSFSSGQELQLASSASLCCVPIVATAPWQR